MSPALPRPLSRFLSNTGAALAAAGRSLTAVPLQLRATPLQGLLADGRLRKEHAQRTNTRGLNLGTNSVSRSAAAESAELPGDAAGGGRGRRRPEGSGRGARGCEGRAGPGAVRGGLGPLPAVVPRHEAADGAALRHVRAPSAGALLGDGGGGGARAGGR